MNSSQELEATSIISRLGPSDCLKLQVEFPNIYACLKYGELNKMPGYLSLGPSSSPSLGLKLLAFDISTWNTGFATTLPRAFEHSKNAFAILADVASYTDPEQKDADATSNCSVNLPEKSNDHELTAGSSSAASTAFTTSFRNGYGTEEEKGNGANSGGGRCEGGVVGGSSRCPQVLAGKDLSVLFNATKLSPSNAPQTGRPGKRVSRTWVVASPFELESNPVKKASLDQNPKKIQRTQ
jgi:hypothetical protein